MFRDHPNWVQIGQNGEPNVFYGSHNRVHWVDPETESAWMSFHSSYLDMLLDRVRKIAGTDVDSIWLDVPLFNDIATSWADLSPAAVAKFQADTGLKAPAETDWTDAAWRRWIAWRYGEIVNLVDRITAVAKVVSPNITIIIENMTVDNSSATMLGLDGGNFKTRSDLIQVWEVDVLSDETAMRRAQPDDWISIIGMAKFAKAASGAKPSWMFTYGQKEDDSLLVIAEALATGNHPFESKVPSMGTTVGTAFRKRTFAWIKANDARLFASASSAKVAIYFSPESRDYVDQAGGTGLYATIATDDNAWWSDTQADSVYARTYLADYRGVIKWFVRNHVPFDIVVKPDQTELSRYQLVIAPSLEAISDRDAAVLDEYVKSGGRLVLTGPAPAALDEFGNDRSTSALTSLHRPKRLTEVSGSGQTPAVKGTSVHFPELWGRLYLVKEDLSAAAAIAEEVRKYSSLLLETDANRSVHIELRKTARETLLHLVNPEGLWNKDALKEQRIFVKLAVPDGSTVSKVQLTSPVMEPAKETELPFVVEENWISFQVPLRAYVMVIISTSRDSDRLGQGAAGPRPHTLKKGFPGAAR